MTLTQHARALTSRAQVLRLMVQCEFNAVQRRLRDREAVVVEMEGLLRGRLPVTVLYAGRGRWLQDVRLLLFSGDVALRECARTSAFHLHQALNQAARPSTDLRLWEAWPWETSTSDAYVVQPWLDANATPGRDWEAFKRKQMNVAALRALKRAEQSGCTLRVTSDKAALLDFYHRMMVPMARHIFGGNVYLPDVATFMGHGAGEDRQLVLVEKEGTALAGLVTVFVPSRSEVWLPHQGALPAVLDDKGLRAHVHALSNAWAFQQACERGFRVNLALTRPFMDDGVFNNKRSWGSRLQAVPAQPRFRLQLTSPRQDAILRAAPLFHIAPDGIRGLMSFAPASSEVEHELAAMVHGYAFPGLRGITVRVAGPTALAQQLARDVPVIKGCPMEFISAGGHATVEELTPPRGGLVDVRPVSAPAHGRP